MDTTQHTMGGTSAQGLRVIGAAWRDARTLAVQVALLPGDVYVLDLNSVLGTGLRAANGELLPPVPWRFATVGDPLEPGAATVVVGRVFAALRGHYAYRDRLGIDWAEFERLHGDDLASSPHLAALALRLAELLASAQDPHLAVSWRQVPLPTFSPAVAANFDPRGLQVVLPGLERIGRTGLLGRTADGIGYLHVGSFAREHRDDFDRLLEGLRTLRECRGIVVDVRTNAGGDEALARRLAGFFVTGEQVFGGFRVCQPDGFGPVQERTVRGNVEPDVYLGSVAVLMGRTNIATSESFLLMMKQAPKAFLVGADSYGSFGNPRLHAVAPGLAVLLPGSQALRPDGTCFEGEGITPHIHVAAAPDEFVAGDPVLAEALLRLRVIR
jgi:hypothetical protein